MPARACTHPPLPAPRPPATLQVLPNAYQGIRGGYTVNVVWLITQEARNWEAELPADTRAWLAATRSTNRSTNL